MHGKWSINCIRYTALVSACEGRRAFFPSSRLSLGIHAVVCHVGTSSYFPGDKEAGTWSWPLTSDWCRGQENVKLYVHSPIRLHGIVLNKLSTDITLSFSLLLRLFLRTWECFEKFLLNSHEKFYWNLHSISVSQWGAAQRLVSRWSLKESTGLRLYNRTSKVSLIREIDSIEQSGRYLWVADYWQGNIQHQFCRNARIRI
jgi:hypothetical protein